MKLSSKNRLMPMHQELFPDDTLFHRIARAVCRVGTLPRKELYEAGKRPGGCGGGSGVDGWWTWLAATGF